MNARKIILSVFPNASASLMSHIIWGRTAYPFKPISARELWRAADRWRRATQHHRQLCDWCDRPALTNCLCLRCWKALQTDTRHST